MQDVEFLEVPEIGKSATFTCQGQRAVSSPVVSLETDPNYPGWYLVTTQSGSEYMGPSPQAQGQNRTVYGAPACAGQMHATLPGAIPTSPAGSLSTNDLLGYLGGAALLFGLFSPMVTAPLIGSMNFLMGGIGPGMLLIVVGPLAILFTVLRLRKAQLAAGAASAVLVGLGFALFLTTKYRSLAESTRNHDAAETAGGVMGTVAIGIGWGWALLVIGALLLVAAGWPRKSC